MSEISHPISLALIYVSHRANKMSITSGDKVFSYMVRDSLCFLTMTESRYPKRLSFLYLDEVGDLVLQELVREFGNGVSSNE
jgi:Regulated-SNARE-like domain